MPIRKREIPKYEKRITDFRGVPFREGTTVVYQSHYGPDRWIMEATVEAIEETDEGRVAYVIARSRNDGKPVQPGFERRKIQNPEKQLVVVT